MSSIMSDEHAEKLGRMLREGKQLRRCLSCGRDVEMLYEHKPLFENSPDGKKIRYTLEAVEYRHLIGLCKECSEWSAIHSCNDIVRKFRESVRGKHK